MSALPSWPAISALRHAIWRLGDQARSRPTLFYLGLAGVFIAAILVNLAWSLATPGVKSSSLDLAVRMRLSSPKPDPSILIVDIDERSLALMAPDHGRWPWPRSVIAEMIAGLSDAGARSILVNLTFSDPDRDHPDDDAIFQDVLAHTPNVVLPITRLNPANDGLSQVAITRFAGAQLRDRAKAARPIAILAPAFPAAYGRLGFNNLRVDRDGAVRRFDPWHEEAGFAFPSLPLRALEAGGVQPDIVPGEFPNGMILNWRNKRGDYAHRSFADALADLDSGDPARLDRYKGRFILIGTTAVGLGSLKGTAASALTDDNTILATAMDDMKSGTYLRTIPVWMTALLSIASILALAGVFIFRLDQRWINSLFAVLQTGFIAVTIYFVSYTYYLVDISAAILLALSYFTIAKVYAAIHLNALRGNPAFSDFVQSHDGGLFLLAGVGGNVRDRRHARMMVRRMERHFGVRNVLYVDNLFNGGHLLQQQTQNMSFVVVATTPRDIDAATAATQQIAEGCDLSPRLAQVQAEGTPQDVNHIFRAILGVAGAMV
ncbi:MAG: CHASE2 domain-containing protein [Alphaproteobacteria bacterium]|nr:CHASE2 domain-containing protein [Alphaproteobacteria bacterium]